MSANTEARSNSLDTLKWGLVILLLAAAVVGNYLLAELSAPLRVAGVIVTVAVAGLIALQTEKGQQTLSFARESRVEVRKVVWPTRQESVQTTLIVFAVTLVMALVLWGLDGVFVRLIGWFTGVE